MKSKLPLIYTVGETYHNYKVTKFIKIPELQCSLIELVHIPSDAHIMHIANDDPENLFCLSFRTTPENSSGVAHILEHTVLCGSKKFPVKDPFFSMNRRSLNTFMNALTGSDFTCYPAATQIPKDFYNLLDVYLDAVFHPILNRLSFLQEGHRLEFAIPNDPKSPLEYKGVVFNEMKGAMASSSTRLIEALNRTLFPDITYGYNSGGDPADIPNLTYEELIAFHEKYYHPSRCLFFFYGNLPLEEHLDFISEHILDKVEKVPQLPPVPLQPRYKEPVRIIETFPSSDEHDLAHKCLIGFGWLTCHILEQDTLLALSLLEIILLDTDASPLKMALMKSGFCKQVSAFFDGEVSEASFYITLKGCNAEDADKVEAFIREKLQEVVKNGIPMQLVDNALHQLEFHRSEITGDHTPFGLTLFMRSALLKQHGANPEDGLMIHSLFERLSKFIHQDPHYLTGFITKYLLDNPHFVRVVMLPDPELAARELAIEKASLEKLREELTEISAAKIIAEAMALKELQASEDDDENPDILPKVSLDDVPRTPTDYPILEEQVGVLKVFHHECFTNEIVYIDLVYDLPYLEESELSYARLFAMLISQIGCADRDYAQNLDYIQAHTGGVGASLALNLQARDHTQFHPTFCLRGKALHREADKLFTLIVEMATKPNFSDLDRIKEIILKHYTALETSLNQGALRYAINLSASGIDVASKIANVWYGLDYFYLIKDIAQNFETKGPELIAKCMELCDRLLGLENPQLVVTCDIGMYEKAKKEGFFGLSKLPTKPFKKWEAHFEAVPIIPQAKIISSPIAFLGKVFKTISYVHPDAAALSVAAFLFDNITLHIKLREQGGAYGGGAVSNVMSGNFYFYTYRDPNIKSSLEAFEESVKVIINGEFDDGDLEEAKIEMLQSMDAPVAPGSRGDLAYGWRREGKTYEMRQAYRNRLLSLKREDVIKAVKEHILPNLQNGSAVVFAGKELLEKENAALEAVGEKPFPISSI